MRVADLLARLANFPQDAEVWYEDGNFGGASKEFKDYDIKLDESGIVLISSPYWTDITDGEYD
jgi:hypothetical protein